MYSQVPYTMYNFVLMDDILIKMNLPVIFNANIVQIDDNILHVDDNMDNIEIMYRWNKSCIQRFL